MNYLNFRAIHSEIFQNQRDTQAHLDKQHLASTFREHIVFHVLKNDSRWSFYAVLFMQKLNSVYENLYDYESDYELRFIIEKIFIMTRICFFKNQKKGQKQQLKE